MTEKNFDGKKILSIRAFQVTVHVRGDISEVCYKAILKWVNKHTDYDYFVLEHDASGVLHLHGLMCFPSPREGRRIHDDLFYYVKKFHPDSIGKFALKVQCCPGNKWRDEYLNKDAGRTVLSDNWDVDKVVDYFPTDSEQADLRAMCTSKIADKYIHGLVTGWTEDSTEITFLSALSYLRYRQFVVKNVKCIADPRRERQIARLMYMYRRGTREVTAADERFFDSEIGLAGFAQPVGGGAPGDAVSLWSNQDLWEPCDGGKIHKVSGVFKAD